MSDAPRALALDYGDMEEVELVGWARVGRPNAFRVIMQRHNQRLFRVARSVVRNDAEAEDVLQEAYTRAFENLDGFRGESSSFTWLTSVTLNEARGRLRKRRLTVGVGAIEAAQQSDAQIIMLNSASATESPESSAARSQMRLLIEQAVDELPEPFRIVFIMREVEELSVGETAAILKVPTNTVKTRLHRARRLLRRGLNERFDAAVGEAFPFLGALCERLTMRVLTALGVTRLSGITTPGGDSPLSLSICARTPLRPGFANRRPRAGKTFSPPSAPAAYNPVHFAAMAKIRPDQLPRRDRLRPVRRRPLLRQRLGVLDRAGRGRRGAGGGLSRGGLVRSCDPASGMGGKRTVTPGAWLGLLRGMDLEKLVPGMSTVSIP